MAGKSLLITYDDISEVESTMRQTMPPRLYKYKGDWSNPHNRSLVLNNEIWMSAPSSLNDPQDITIPLKFAASEIDDARFFEKMLAAAAYKHPQLAHDPEKLRVVARNQLQIIKENPERAFVDNYKQLKEDKFYDNIGLFCCSTDETDELMWGYYGGSGEGFCVGFNTVELTRDLKCGLGIVNYSNEVVEYSFINKDDVEDNRQFFLKGEKWKHEKEYRYVTYGIENEQRKKYYKDDAIAEFVLGVRFPKDRMQDFINEVRKKHGKNIPIYQIEAKISEHGFEKKLID